MPSLSRVDMQLILNSEGANMGIETITILMLMTFILGMVVGMLLARPSHNH